MPTLVALSTPGRLSLDAAESFERVRYALSQAGIESGTTDPWHAFRSDADQVELFERNYTTTVIPGRSYSDGGIKRWDGKTWYRRDGKPVTAIPGTSNHGDGDTADWQNLGPYVSTTWNIAARILRDHGWNNLEGAKIGEPWHWTYIKSNDKHLGEAVPVSNEDVDKIVRAVWNAKPDDKYPYSTGTALRNVDNRTQAIAREQIDPAELAALIIAAIPDDGPAVDQATIEKAFRNVLASLGTE